MFDIGWGELVVIGIVALIAIGPKELPAVLRTIGQYMGKVRRMANEFQGQFQEALREAEVAELHKQAEQWKASVTDFANYDALADADKSAEERADKSEDIQAEMNVEPGPAGDDETPPAFEAAAVPGSEVAIDLPLPEPLPPVASEDFVRSETAAEASPPAAAPKQAGGAA